MKKTLKKGLLALCAVTATLCTSLSVGAIASAGESTVTGKSIDEVTFTMVNGASIRADSFGIRFSATMSEADYTALDAYYEEEIEFGTFIMAANYKTAVSKGTFEESHFFGDYDADETTSSLYTWDGASVSENRVKILQMDSKIYYDEEWQTMRINGSVTSVYDHNLDMDYVGISYIKVGNEYRLATQGDNARSVVYVAQLAIEANKKAEDVTAGSSVLTHYTTEVEEAVKTVNYTVNTYLHDEENGAVKYDTTVLESPLNGTAEAMNIAESINGYEYVASRSTTSGVAYIGDKLVLELYYHKKANRALYDFYDKAEADVDLYGNGTYAEIDDVSAVKYVKKSGPWDTVTFPTEIDEKFDVANVNYIYLEVYSKEVSVGVETRFTYYTYSETTTTDETTGETTTTGKWSENAVSFIPNTWEILRIPVNANTPSLASIKFGFQKNLGSSNWQAIGMTSGEALYFREVGVFSNTVAYDDYTGTFETSVDFGIFRPDNKVYQILSNENEAYVKEGKRSLLLQAEPQWPIYYFTQGFINWLKENKIASISFDVYIENTNGNITAVEGGILKEKWNQWYTVTLATSSITTSSKLQVNKTKASTNSYIYIDNMQFSYIDYTDITESTTNLSPLFSVKNTAYKMSVNTDKTYVNEGNYSLKLYATPQWPQYYFTQEFIDWLKENNITSISFDVYINNTDAVKVTAVEGGILKAKYNQWYTVTLATSKITTSSRLQVNKDVAKTLSFYIDNMQFTYGA